jgi:Fe-S-cluster-containing hydrogenase component 2
MINTEKSAIQIQKDDLDTSRNLPILCNQCKDMKCLNGEDVFEALEKKRFIWDRKRAQRCPFGALTVFGEKAYHCDLCGGMPQCVTVCTPKALRIAYGTM